MTDNPRLCILATFGRTHQSKYQFVWLWLVLWGLMLCVSWDLTFANCSCACAKVMMGYCPIVIFFSCHAGDTPPPMI